MLPGAENFFYEFVVTLEKNYYTYAHHFRVFVVDVGRGRELYYILFCQIDIIRHCYFFEIP